MGQRSLVLTVALGVLGVPLACDQDSTTPPSSTAGAGTGGTTPVGGNAGTSSGSPGGSGGATSGDAGRASRAGAPATGGVGAVGGTEGGAGGAAGDSCEGEGGEAGGCTAFDEPPSCVGLATACGPSGTDSCCATRLVPAESLGPFSRSNDPAYPATLSDFRLDRYEVTLGRFRAFAAAYAAGWRPADGAGRNPNDALDTGWNGAAWNAKLPEPDVEAEATGVLCDTTFQTWTSQAGSTESESRPINCVTWFVAEAFCIWDGQRLPTEAEWNYAAAGGGDALGWRQYPWSEPSSSTTIDETRASYHSTDCLADGAAGCSLTDILVVGSRPAGDGRFGHADLAGNVGEWTYDPYGPYSEVCVNCTNEIFGPDRSFRGGSYDNDASFLLTSWRRGRDPRHHAANVGVRCATSLP